MFMPQLLIIETVLPSPAEKLDILNMSSERLAAAGYVYIGMDHFARPDDLLAVAQRNLTLYRNFQGYSTHAECDLVAFGITAICMVGNTYSQNVKKLEEYYQRLDAGELPIHRGVSLDADDLLRREVITQLICHFELDMARNAEPFAIDFARYFAEELRELAPFEADGIVDIKGNLIRVLPACRLLISNVCMGFDRYLRSQPAQRYSKGI